MTNPRRIITLGLACAMWTSSAWGSEAIDFSQDILPILSDKCFVCHGPDAAGEGQDQNLRLDSYASATVDLGGYRAIDPVHPEKSEVLARIHSTDNPMPPADAEKQLSNADRELLTRWVRQGGDYAAHWAFVPPRKQLPVSPSGAELNVPESEVIDAFVQARLQEKNLKSASRADQATLARRVALVLTGLPPDTEALHRYLGDDSANAYERLVDELLADPRFGEHQARYWLDAVRYGDTHGLHLDNRRGIYPYRDWVVRAFNDNLPLDDFITWQLAGDLLPNPTLAQRVATGFVRMNPTTSEGGALPEEFQAKNNFDRTETLGTVLLGMTLTCARCHTHKYDPIPQTEYYQLMAFFNSTAESSMDGNAYAYGPIAHAPADQQGWSEWNAIESRRRALMERADTEVAALRADSVLTEYARFVQEGSVGPWQKSAAVSASDSPPDPADWQDVTDLPGSSQEKLPPVGQVVWLSCDLDLKHDQTRWLTINGGPDSTIQLDGNPVPRSTDAVNDTTSQPLQLTAGTHRLLLRLAGRANAPNIELRWESPWQALIDHPAWSSCPIDDQLRMLADPQGPLASLAMQDEGSEILQQVRAVTATFTTTLVAQELPTPRETRLLRRGEYDLPAGEPLQPGILNVMGAFPADAPNNRLGLARWLTSRNHPLVARVLINRVWQSVFGAALMRTPEDFGVQGQQPTHPRLLDWLAVELQDSGWDLKHMLRLMVTSDAFQQSSAWRADLDDPENRWLARGPGYRLDAEVLRDIGLWASGLLDPHMGGEGVKPYQPSGLWLAMAHPASNTKDYLRDQGPRLYRRSLYVYWKRTSPHPMMTLFDAPDRESSCVRRSRTSTALQSLGLLNEQQRVEMARMLAERLLHEVPTDTQRMDRLFEMLTCRTPTDVERTACQRLLDGMRDRYANADNDALELLSTGDAPRDETLVLADHAAWTQLVITVLASDLSILLY